MEDKDDFGDISLFEEFEKDREQLSSFINESDGVANYKVHSLKSEKHVSDGTEDKENGDNHGNGHEKVDRPSATVQPQSQNQKFDSGLTNCTAEVKRLVTPRHSSPGPAIEVLFTDSKLSRLYHSEILTFISNLLSSTKHDSDPLGKITSKNSVKLDQSQAEGSEVIACAHFYREFFVDQLGWPLVNYTPELTESWDVPLYEQIFKSCLPCDEDEDDGPPPRPKATCFNCDGDHNLADCKEPRNQAKISKRIREFKASKGSSGSRYHIETDPRFVSFKPGVFSEDLRKALGVRSSQLPLFIYQMRNLGYPPGHLRDAELNASGISMFDKHGKEVNIDGDTMEEGEVDDDNDTTDTQFDVSKIIEYPGFNVPVPEGISDDWRALGFPPMNVSQSKLVFEEMIKHKTQMKEERGRKRKLNAEAAKDAKRSRIESDMEMGDSDDEKSPAKKRSFRPPLPMETPPRTPMAPPLPLNTPPVTPRTPMNPPLPLNTPPVTPGVPPLPKGTPPPTPTDIPRFSIGDEDGPDSPEEMNNQGGVVIKAIPLDNVDSSSDVEISSAASSNVPSRATSAADFNELENQRSALLQQLEQMGNESSQDSQTSVKSDEIQQGQRYSTPITNRSMSVELGTPVLQGESPSMLPSFDKFAIGIAEHIPFENLPNVAGTYNKLQNVLKDVRSKHSK